MNRFEAPIDNIENTGDALRFYTRMNGEMDKGIYNEQHAKDAAITALVMRKPLILSGLPGGGKSTLSEMIPGLIAGVESSDIALISGQHDLNANQLIGGEVNSSKEKITNKGAADERVDEEVNHTRIDGIVKPHTKVLRLEEMSGTNPNALRSLLPVLENGRIENAAGELEIPGLLTVIGTMNPADSGESTFEISDAMASRFGAGAIMGVKGSREQRLQYAKEVRKLEAARYDAAGNKLRPKDMVNPVVTEAGLVAVRGYVLSTEMDQPTTDKLDEIAIDTTDALGQYEIVEETDRRISQQIEMSAKVLAGLRNRDKVVRDEDLHDATRSIFVARTGALKRADNLDIESIIKNITKL